MLKVDQSRKPYLFWDIDLDKFDASKYPEFTIARILEHGALVDISWMFKSFSKEKIIETLKSVKYLPRSNAIFWANYFNINLGEIKCLKKESIQIPGKF